MKSHIVTVSKKIIFGWRDMGWESGQEVNEDGSNQVEVVVCQRQSTTHW